MKSYAPALRVVAVRKLITFENLWAANNKTTDYTKKKKIINKKKCKSEDKKNKKIESYLAAVRINRSYNYIHYWESNRRRAYL